VVVDVGLDLSLGISVLKLSFTTSTVDELDPGMYSCAAFLVGKRLYTALIGETKRQRRDPRNRSSECDSVEYGSH
jgi:hypothetical protein